MYDLFPQVYEILLIKLSDKNYTKWLLVSLSSTLNEVNRLWPSFEVSWALATNLWKPSSHFSLISSQMINGFIIESLTGIGSRMVMTEKSINNNYINQLIGYNVVYL